MRSNIYDDVTYSEVCEFTENTKPIYLANETLPFFKALNSQSRGSEFKITG